jgi:uncharacterized protein (TIGR01777 family)
VRCVRVLIGGASGLLGTALSCRLVSRGHDARVLVRREARGAGEVAWDPQAGRLPDDALAGVDVVVNLNGASIGERRWTDAQKERLRASRLGPTELLAGRIAAGPDRPRLFVTGSAVGYYGDAGDETLTEDHAGGDDFMACLCRDWEAAAAPAEAAGVRTVRLRSGVVLARDGGILGQMIPPFRLGLGGRTGSGDQWMSWVAIDDFVRAVEFVIDEESIAGPVNVVAPNPARNRDFTRALAKALRRPAVLPTPLPVLRLRYGRELVDGLMLVSQRVVPARLAEGGFTFEHADIDSAIRSVLGSARSDAQGD